MIKAKKEQNHDNELPHLRYLFARKQPKVLLDHVDVFTSSYW